MRETWRTAWITGASSGIGRELALALAARGVTVAVSARRAESLAELAALSDRIRPYPVDVTDRTAVAATVRALHAALGSLDLVVLNAGVWHSMGARDFSAEHAGQSMAVNYGGITNALEPLLPLLMAQKRGRVALVASVAGYRGLPRAAAYAPSKAAVIALAEVLQPDLARHGVAVSVINPGFVETPMTAVNKFPMPFSISAADAAQRIVRGLERGKFEIAFPWQLVTMLKVLRVLPNALFLRIARRMMPGTST